MEAEDEGKGEERGRGADSESEHSKKFGGTSKTIFFIILNFFQHIAELSIPLLPPRKMLSSISSKFLFVCVSSTTQRVT